MNKLRFALTLACIAAIGAPAVAAPAVTIVTPGSEHWMPQPGNYSMAVLYGNPSGPGFYIVRLKAPPNWAFRPHTHPTRENVTIISGTLYFGLGTTYSPTKANGYSAGTFASIPAATPHFALTKSTGAVFQIEGMGPFKVMMIHK